MAKLLALRVLSGKMSFAELQNNYSKYAEEVLKIIDEKGYKINSDGHCVKVTVTVLRRKDNQHGRFSENFFTA